jgi:hypothetical protein
VPAPKKLDTNKLAELMSSAKRSDSWTRDELEALVCAFQECGDDADVLVGNCRTLGLKRSVTAIHFQLMRAMSLLGVPVPEKVVRRLKILGQADRKESTLDIVEVITKAKGSTAIVVPPPQSEPEVSSGKSDHLRTLVEYEVLGVRIGKQTKEQAFDAIALLVRR